jgi:transcription antitermination factor NusG
MERGDRVMIRSGAWIEKTGTVIFVDHVSNDVTLALDVGPTHMIKTSMNNVERVTCNMAAPVVQ